MVVIPFLTTTGDVPFVIEPIRDLLKRQALSSLPLHLSKQVEAPAEEYHLTGLSAFLSAIRKSQLGAAAAHGRLRPARSLCDLFGR